MNDSGTFKNIRAIDANIRELYASIGTPLVPKFAANLVIDYRFYQSDVLLFTQTIAKQIADHFGLHIARIVVSFASNLGVPGNVNLSTGKTFFITIDEQYKFNANFISAILAHEIAHIYLHKHNIRLSDTFLNEVLTDTTAAFLGCAWLLLNSSSEETSYFTNQTKVHSFGYITQSEVGYIVAKRDFLLQQNSSDAMIYGRSREYFAAGKAHFLKSLGRPYVQRSALGNLAYRLTSGLKKRSIDFRCICCEQQLNIPATNESVSVHCPTCGNNLPCFS